MSPELIAILAVGVTLAGVLLSGQRALRSEIQDVRSEIADLRERMAKLEGLLEGLREAIVARAAQNVAQ